MQSMNVTTEEVGIEGLHEDLAKLQISGKVINSFQAQPN
jgi:hypothetical protein